MYLLKHQINKSVILVMHTNILQQKESNDTTITLKRRLTENVDSRKSESNLYHEKSFKRLLVNYTSVGQEKI